MFGELFQRFMNTRAEHYGKDKLGGLKVHVPIPFLVANKRYGLSALLHGLWATHIGRPYEILLVSDEDIEYIEINEEEREQLGRWKGLVYDQDFSENEERLLEMSVDVFNCYLSGSKNELVEEYAQRFAAITPPEFMFYYRQLNAGFLDWLALEAVWKDSQ